MPAFMHTEIIFTNLYLQRVLCTFRFLGKPNWDYPYPPDNPERMALSLHSSNLTQPYDRFSREKAGPELWA
uniref:Uncharacterized protein n=1 Tax=Rhizophora mucronata TaxID=61149 RepID=A0A2P2LMP9_RHIMU